MKPKQLIIIGGGRSVSKGVQKGLWSALKGRLTCGINYSYRYFDSTCLACMNYTDFYDINRVELAKLPLIVSCKRPQPSIWEDNTILMDRSYRLSGILAIDVGIKILEEGEIYLLGYDYSGSHFYNNKNSVYYDRGFGDRDFGEFRNSKVKIYNVSLNSNINVFPKISYNTFFKHLDDSKYNQKGLVNEIRRKFCNE